MHSNMWMCYSTIILITLQTEHELLYERQSKHCANIVQMLEVWIYYKWFNPAQFVQAIWNLFQSNHMHEFQYFMHVPPLWAAIIVIAEIFTVFYQYKLDKTNTLVLNCHECQVCFKYMFSLLQGSALNTHSIPQFSDSTYIFYFSSLKVYQTSWHQ